MDGGNGLTGNGSRGKEDGSGLRERERRDGPVGLAHGFGRGCRMPLDLDRDGMANLDLRILVHKRSKRNGCTMFFDEASQVRWFFTDVVLEIVVIYNQDFKDFGNSSDFVIHFLNINDVGNERTSL